MLLDGSESMRYGSGVAGMGPVVKETSPAGVSKFDYGRVMAACLAYLVLHQRDAVALGIFDEWVKQYVPRTGNPASIHNIMTVLSRFEPKQTTGIGEVLHAMAAQIKRRGIVILISDLLDDEERILDGIRHLRFGGSEVIVFHTMDPYELEMPFGGNVEFEGLEGVPALRTRPREVRQSYLRELEAFRSRLRDGCERNKSHFVPVNTGLPLREMLSAYLAFRTRTARARA
jgi:uncharacterized protein (DUF58 family)